LCDIALQGRLGSRAKCDLSQNIHFFEENCQKQGRFVPQRQKLSWGVKICQWPAMLLMSRAAGLATFSHQSVKISETPSSVAHEGMA
jgi:hypothetical protein